VLLLTIFGHTNILFCKLNINKKLMQAYKTRTSGIDYNFTGYKESAESAAKFAVAVKCCVPPIPQAHF
jgi:hypothetical protein